MPLLADSAITLLGSKSAIDMKTAASTTVYTTPVGKTTRITHVIVRDPSATLAGGTSYSVTNWQSGIDLHLLTTTTSYTVILPTAGASYTEIAAATAVQWTVTTGSTGAATATVEIFGYTT